MPYGLLLPSCLADRPNGKDWLQRPPLGPWIGNDGGLIICGGSFGRRRLLFAGMEIARIQAGDATGDDVLLPSAVNTCAVEVGRSGPVGKLVVKIGRIVGVPAVAGLAAEVRTAVKWIILLARRSPKVVQAIAGVPVAF